MESINYKTTLSDKQLAHNIQWELRRLLADFTIQLNVEKDRTFTFILKGNREVDQLVDKLFRNNNISVQIPDEKILKHELTYAL